MGHHGSQQDPAISEAIQEIMRGAKAKDDDLKLGATGRFPLGKITSSDEGEIKLAVGAKEGNVIIDFGTQVVWVGFTPTQARLIAESLIERADQLDPLPSSRAASNETPFK